MSEQSDRLDLIIRDKVAEAVRESDWAPDAGVITNVVVVMEWMTPDDTELGMSWYRTGSLWSAEGMLRMVLRAIEGGDVAGRHDDEGV